VRNMGTAKKLLSALAVNACATVAAAGLLLCTLGPSAAQSIKIGVVVPITSVLAPYGTPFVEALNLAVDAANAAGRLG